MSYLSHFLGVLACSLSSERRLLRTFPVTERLCTWSDDNLDERGKPTPEYIELYKIWGEGAIGTIVLGNLPVDRIQPEAKKNAVIDKRNVRPSPSSSFFSTKADHPTHSAAALGRCRGLQACHRRC